MDLSKLPDLCRLLENVCTARDFLLEVGGPGDKSLAEFMVILIRTIEQSVFNIFSLGVPASLYRRRGQFQEQSSQAHQTVPRGRPHQVPGTHQS